MKVILKSKSSFSHYYNVTFDFYDGKIRILCDCPHGDWKRVCKHRLALIAGDKSMLYDRRESDQLDAVLARLKNPEFDLVLRAYYQKLAILEKQKKTRDEGIKELNYDFGFRLAEGISISQS
ncbi:MAG: hypothetical protein L6Q77_09430 [Bacteroidetes bacterium]|nr:hypothetical protein [Bacteroidota bacterium]